MPEKVFKELSLEKAANMRRLLLFSLLLSYSQLRDKKKGLKKRHAASYFNGLTFIPNSAHFERDSDTVNIELNERQHVQCFGFSYQYNFNYKWSLGGIVEMELARYFISDNGVPLARENIFVVALAGVL